MECPNCHHQAASASLVKCSSCGQAYERRLLEEFEHIQYLITWLNDNRERVGKNADDLFADLKKRQSNLRSQMHFSVPEIPVAVPLSPVADVATQAGVLPVEPVIFDEKITASFPAAAAAEPREVSQTVPAAVSNPAAMVSVPISTAAAAVQPVVMKEPVSAHSKPAAPASPAPAAKPVVPPVDWGKAWDRAVNFVVSGALLRALLYMGAFMIVVSAAVLVINFWNIFPPILQVAFMFALPTAFYVGGWLTRTRLRLIQAGTVITGIGAVLLAVDFAALYQFNNLSIEINLYWLFASLVTTAMYVFTVYRLGGEFFSYLMYLGGISILLAVTRVFQAPLVWTIAIVPLAGVGLIGSSILLNRRGDSWREIAQTARYLPQVLMPISLAVILFVDGPNSQVGKLAAFLFATVAYGLLAWKFPAVHQLLASVLALAGAVSYGVLFFDAAGLWLPAAGAILAVSYILTGRCYFDGTGVLLTSAPDHEKLRWRYRQLLYASGLILSLAVLISSIWLVLAGNQLEAAIPVTLLAFSFCAWSSLLRQPLFGFIGSGLLFWPFWLWLDLAGIQSGFYPMAYLLLISGFHLPAGILTRRTEPKFAVPFEWVGWLAAVLIFFAGFNPVLTSPAWAPALTYSLLMAYLIVNAWYYRRVAFAWGIALVFSISSLFWMNTMNIFIEQAAMLWAGLAFVYLFIEYFLGKSKDPVWAKRGFRAPFAMGVVVLGLLALVVSSIGFFQNFGLFDRLPSSLAAQAMLVFLTILAARLHHSRWPLFVEPFLVAFLATLFFSAYSPNLFGRALEWYQYGLVFCAVAWLHLLVAAGLDNLGTRYSHGLYLGGYGLAVVSILFSVVDLPTLLWTLAGFIVAMVASVFLLEIKRYHTWDEFVSLFGPMEGFFARLVRNAFLWAAAWLFPIWCMLLLTYLEYPFAVRWLGLCLSALLYLPLGTRLARRNATHARPLFSAAHTYVLLALLMNVDRVLGGMVQVALDLSAPVVQKMPEGALTIQASIGQGLVQLAVLVFTVAWAWMKRQQLFAQAAAWISIFALTSFLFSLPTISAEQIVIAWTGWAGLLLLAGFLLDRLPDGSPRYAHGAYLAGYSLAIGALLISIQQRRLNIIVLGMFMLFAVASAVVVHFKRHRTWDEFSGLFGRTESTIPRLVRGAFLWVLAWLFPLWCTQILILLRTPFAYRWLALSIPALGYLALGSWLAKKEPTYSWPFFSAAHLYTLIAFLASLDQILAVSSRVAWGLSLAPLPSADLQATFGQGLIQLAAVVFTMAWAWMKRQNLFAHFSAWLSILSFTALLASLQLLSAEQFVVAWAAWAMLLMLTGFGLDRLPKASTRHAHGPTLAGYALIVFTMLVSMQALWLNTIVLGMGILSAVLSFMAVHFKLLRSFDDFIAFFWRRESLIRRGVRLLFLFFAVYALPVWILQLELYYQLATAWQGVSLALLGPVLISAGLFLRRLNPDYKWPCYSMGYSLTVIGALLAFNDQRLTVYVLALDVIVYAASAIIFRQPFWLYLATCLAPITVLVTLQYNDSLTSQWIAWAFSMFAFLYFGLGQWLDQRRPENALMGSYSLALYAPGYLLSAIALVLSNRDPSLALAIYPANILLYALSAWRFHRTIFLYPVAWLSIVPYSLFVSRYFTIPFEWQGLVWLPLILVFIGLGRFVFHRSALNLKSPRAILNALTFPAMPFYLIAYALTVTMILGSRWAPLPLTLALAAASLLYLASAFLFRHPAWLYPTLFTAHLTVLAYFSIHPSGNPLRFITLPFLVLTWLEALAGYLVSRRYPVTEMTANGRVIFKFAGRQFDFGAFPSLGYLTVLSWAQPIFIVVALDSLLWEGLALSSLDTGLWVSAGLCLLFALFATLWQDQLLAHIALGLGSLAFSFQLRSLGISIPQIFAGLGGLALILYLFSWLVEWLKGLSTAWRQPLINFAIMLSVLGLAITLPDVFSDSIPAAFALGFGGALYLSMSLRRRTTLLGYFGMGMLLAGWSLLLFKQNVGEPQYYALPAGLYFAGMGFIERVRRPGRFALLIESLGLALLLVTSFIQSVNAVSGFPYFLLLLAEGLAVVWWGAARHLRVPFSIGILASVANILAQVVVLVRTYDVNRWIIIFGVGILIVGLGLFIERRREMLLARSQEFRDMLESWD